MHFLSFRYLSNISLWSTMHPVVLNLYYKWESIPDDLRYTTNQIFFSIRIVVAMHHPWENWENCHLKCFVILQFTWRTLVEKDWKKMIKIWFLVYSSSKWIAKVSLTSSSRLLFVIVKPHLCHSSESFPVLHYFI